MRLFVGISLPDTARAALTDLIAGLAPSVPGARWVPASNLHATIAFLGEVADGRVDEIGDALRAATRGAGSVPTALAEAGAFPHARRARVLWAGLDDPAGSLAAVAAAVTAALRPVGFEPERRAWTAHCTLARLRTPADVSAAIAGATVPPVRFEVADVELFRSRLGRPHAMYEALVRFPLEA